MKPFLVLSLILLAINSAHAQEAEPKNVDEVIARMSAQLDAILEVPPAAAVTLTNKRSPRYFTNDIVAKETSPYITDFEFRVHSPAVTEEFNFPPYLEMDLPEGMAMLAYSQVTHGQETKCMLKFMIRKDLGAEKAKENLFFPLLDQQFMGIGVYRPKNLNPIQFLPAPVVEIGPSKKIKQNKKNGALKGSNYFQSSLLIYAENVHHIFDYYAVNFQCDIGKYLSNNSYLLIRKESGFDGSYSNDYIELGVPHKFLTIITRLMNLTGRK